MRLLLIALAFIPMLGNAAVYKCPDANGRIAFFDKPCGGSAASPDQQLDLKTMELGVSAAQIKEQQRQEQLAPSDYISVPMQDTYCRDFSKAELQSNAEAHQLLVGMKEDDVRRIWGSPAVISGERPVRMTYPWHDSTSYVYMVDGCVWRVDGGYGG